MFLRNHSIKSRESHVIKGSWAAPSVNRFLLTLSETNGHVSHAYNGHCSVGDLRRQITGISNICHLRHDSWQCDCAIKSFGRQTSREMTCYRELK